MKVYIVLAAVAASLAPFATRAQDATASLQVQATVAESCEVTTTPVDFGSVNLLAATAHEATGTILVTCTNDAAYQIALDAGQGADATVTTRQMTRDGGTGTLAYALFSDEARATNWGDTTDTVTGTGTGTANTHDVYAQIPAGQTSVAAGSYADTVTVTVSY
ncbi:spore coat U domain-containing protein [Coralloluteibacterium thermophilus]|uniref:Spore coat U domain-containing protein n=1 Tax=Coralloluteibacterium thermophilum TaxID=2707049 RepID=A0ABV9NIE4_9GAMM